MNSKQLTKVLSMLWAKYAALLDSGDLGNAKDWRKDEVLYDDVMRALGEEAAKVSVIDVRIDWHGSVVIMHALTVAAQEWFEAHLPEDRQRWGRNGAVVEPRYVSDIVAGLTADGLEVAS